MAALLLYLNLRLSVGYCLSLLLKNCFVCSPLYAEVMFRYSYRLGTFLTLLISRCLCRTVQDKVIFFFSRQSAYGTVFLLYGFFFHADTSMSAGWPTCEKGKCIPCVHRYL